MHERLRRSASKRNRFQFGMQSEAPDQVAKQSHCRFNYGPCVVGFVRGSGHRGRGAWTSGVLAVANSREGPFAPFYTPANHATVNTPRPRWREAAAAHRIFNRDRRSELLHTPYNKDSIGEGGGALSVR
jgi:hypothetical protein